MFLKCVCRCFGLVFFGMVFFIFMFLNYMVMVIDINVVVKVISVIIVKL